MRYEIDNNTLYKDIWNSGVYEFVNVYSKKIYKSI